MSAVSYLGNAHLFFPYHKGQAMDHSAAYGHVPAPRGPSAPGPVQGDAASVGQGRANPSILGRAVRTHYSGELALFHLAYQSVFCPVVHGQRSAGGFPYEHHPVQYATQKAVEAHQEFIYPPERRSLRTSFRIHGSQ